MGTSSSKSPVHVGVRLDRHTWFNAGDELSGTVFVHIDDKAHEITAKDVTIVVVGREKTVVEWEETRGDEEQSRTRTRFARASHEFMRTTTVVHTFDKGVCSAGSYEFPFVFALPEDLPRSFDFHADHSSGTVEYLMHAKVNAGYGGNADSSPEVSFAVNGQRAPAVDAPVFKEPISRPINFCCCFQRGRITFGVGLDSGSSSLGSAITGALAVHNDSTSRISGIRAHLQQNVHIRAQRHDDRVNSACGSVGIDLATVNGLDQVQDAAAAGQDNNIEEVAKKLRDKATTFSLPCGADELPTYSGKLITVHYMVGVEVATPMCVTNIVRQLPLVVYARGPADVEAGAAAEEPEFTPTLPSPPPPTSPEQPALPEGWNPTVFEPKRVVVNPEEGDGAPQVTATEDSVEALIARMANSFRDVALVKDFLDVDGHTPLVEATTPEQFARLLNNVRFAMDQAQIAERWADRMGPAFTCAHVAAACELITDDCTPIVRNTATMASDFPANRGLFEAKLTRFELLMGCLPDAQ